MKKIILVCLILIAIMICSCSCNRSMGLGEYEFNTIHVSLEDGSSFCGEIEKWYECERGVEVKLKDGDHIFASEGTYMMFSNECKLCGEK